MTPPPAIPAPAPPPLVAMVINVQTPYRIYAHRRIAREMPEIRLASLFTHDQADQPWSLNPVQEINPVFFGQGQPVATQGRPAYALKEWTKAGRIIRWLKDNRAAAVVVGGYNDPGRLRLIRWCRRAHIPVLVLGDSNIRSDTATGLKRLIKSLLVGWVARSCAALLPCGSLGQAFFERYGGDPARMFYYPYEPDYSLIAAIPSDRVDAALARYGLDRSRQRIVVCARLVPIKRVDLAIDAFAAIAADRPGWDLLIIGDGPLRRSLEDRIPQNLRSRVIWTGFIGDQSIISSLYRGSQVLVCPSDIEPWAVVINESVAAGMAVITSHIVGAAAELVREDVNGYTFPAGDAAALAAHLRDATDPARIGRLRSAAPQVLADWRRRGDPIDGLRRALALARVIAPGPAAAPSSSHRADSAAFSPSGRTSGAPAEYR